MVYLLDTCAWIQTLLEPDLLSHKAREVVEKEPILHSGMPKGRFTAIPLIGSSPQRPAFTASLS